MKTIPLICLQCKCTTYIKPSRVDTAKYCSKECFALGKIGHKPYHYKGGKRTHKGYVYILDKNHPNKDRDGYVTEHRLVMEKKIGRYLLNTEVVHHKNEIRSDNRIENLELLSSQSDHMSEHYPKGKHIYKGNHPRLGKKLIKVL